MEIIKGFWQEVYQKSLEEIRKEFPVNWGVMRLAVGVIISAIAFGAAILVGGLGGKAALTSIIWIFGADAVILAVLWVTIPVMALLRLPWVAERVGKEQRDLLTLYKTWDRLARGEKIGLRERNNGNRAGIEVYNDEDDNPFYATLYVTEVSGQGIMNPIELVTDSGTSFHVIPKNSYWICVVQWSGGSDDPVIKGRVGNPIKFTEDGEYLIKTQLEGSFRNPLFTVEKTNKWKLLFNREKYILQLEN